MVRSSITTVCGTLMMLFLYDHSDSKCDRICPIFQVSNVTGENLELLRTFLSLLSGRMHSNEDKPAEFQIDETYSVPVSDVGVVVSRWYDRSR